MNLTWFLRCEDRILVQKINIHPNPTKNNMEAEHGEMAKDIPNGNRGFNVLILK